MDIYDDCVFEIETHKLGKLSVHTPSHFCVTNRLAVNITSTVDEAATVTTNQDSIRLMLTTYRTIDDRASLIKYEAEEQASQH